MKNQRIGKIDISELNVPPEKHEYETARYFADRGLNVEFIKPSDIKGTNSPDFRMIGRMWEVKCPLGSSERTCEDNLRKAIKQSKNVIFDLRRLKPIDESKCLKILNKYRDLVGLRTLLAIKRDGRLLTLKGVFDIL